jgi:hypothetical protein
MLIATLFSALTWCLPNVPPDSAALPPARWGLALGAQLSAIDYARTQVAPGLNIGLFYRLPLRGAWSLQLEAQSKYLSDFRQQVILEDYLLNPLAGVSSSWREMSVRSLWFAELPVLFVCQSQTQSLFAGLRPSVNWINPEQFPWSGISSQGHSPEDLSRFDDVNIRHGLRRFDMGLTLGWARPLSKRLWLDVRYTQGFFDLTHDNFFKNQATNTNSDLQISLRAGW